MRRLDAISVPDLVPYRDGRHAVAPGAHPGPRSGPRVWAVGGGKGGVGKSVVAAGLAVGLANEGRRCVIVDADLGAANLHTFFGGARPRRSLAHFLRGQVPRLTDALVETSVPNLQLLGGGSALLGAASPGDPRQVDLLRHLRSLDVDEVLLDLGAGTSFEVLDFFLAAHLGILVIAPEPTSVENAYQFLKAAFYRSLRGVAKRASVHSALDRVLGQRTAAGIRSPRDLIEAVGAIDATAGAELARQARHFSPRLLVNLATSEEHRRVGRDIGTACQAYLGAEVTYLGSLDRDPCVVDSVRRRQPALQLFPTSHFSKGLAEIVRGLLAEIDPTPSQRAEPVRDATGPPPPTPARRPLRASPPPLTRRSGGPGPFAPGRRPAGPGPFAPGRRPAAPGPFAPGRRPTASGPLAPGRDSAGPTPSAPLPSAPRASVPRASAPRAPGPDRHSGGPSTPRPAPRQSEPATPPPTRQPIGSTASARRRARSESALRGILRADEVTRRYLERWRQRRSVAPTRKRAGEAG